MEREHNLVETLDVVLSSPLHKVEGVFGETLRF